LSEHLHANYLGARVRSVKRDGLYFHLDIELPPLAQAEPGQFIMLGPGEVDSQPDDPLLMRPMSVLAHEAERMEILFARVGRVTSTFAAASPGDSLRLLGPLGKPFTQAASPLPILVGGGAGVPPLCYLSNRLGAAGIAHRLLLGFNRADDVPRDVLATLISEPEIFTMDGGLGREGHPVAALADDREDGRIQACGPPAMLDALKRVRREGEPMELSLEERMACGMGFCRGCVTPVKDGDAWRYASICRQGPVFDVDDLAEIDEKGEVCHG
jgi:dihydroorotate dehydrogenase electron transfer subunit